MGKDENRIFVRNRFEEMIACGDGTIVSFGCYHQRRFYDKRMKKDIRNSIIGFWL